MFVISSHKINSKSCLRFPANECLCLLYIVVSPCSYKPQNHTRALLQNPTMTTEPTVVNIQSIYIAVKGFEIANVGVTTISSALCGFPTSPSTGVLLSYFDQGCIQFQRTSITQSSKIKCLMLVKQTLKYLTKVANIIPTWKYYQLFWRLFGMLWVQLPHFLRLCGIYKHT